MAVRSRLTLDGTSFDAGEFSRLWWLAAATYGVGDVVTTVAVLQFSPRVDEANPVLAAAVEQFGQPGLVGVKLAAFALCLGVSLDAAHRRDALLFYLPPVALTALGLGLTAHNLWLLTV